MSALTESVAAEAEPTDGALVLGDRPLPPADGVAVARRRRVVVGHAARDRMPASRAALEGVPARGDSVYGLTTGVGAIKTEAIEADRQAAFQPLLPRAHRVGHGSAVRRLHGMAGLALRFAAVGLTCGAQPVDLRGHAGDLGEGTRRASPAPTRRRSATSTRWRIGSPVTTSPGAYEDSPLQTGVKG